LAAETEAEMNKWVMTLCQVLGLAQTGVFMLYSTLCVFYRGSSLLSNSVN